MSRKYRKSGDLPSLVNGPWKSIDINCHTPFGGWSAPWSFRRQGLNFTHAVQVFTWFDLVQCFVSIEMCSIGWWIVIDFHNVKLDVSFGHIRLQI